MASANININFTSGMDTVFSLEKKSYTSFPLIYFVMPT